MPKFEGAVFVRDGISFEYEELKIETQRRLEKAGFPWPKVAAAFKKAKARDKSLLTGDKWPWIWSHFPPPSLLDNPPPPPSAETASPEPEDDGSPLEVVPEEVVSVAPPAEATAVRNPQLWTETDGTLAAEFERDVRWAYHNLAAHKQRLVKPEDAPSPSAWNWLQMAKREEQWFLDGPAKEVVKQQKKREDEKDERRDNGQVLGILRRMVEAGS
jgi:hypothetical protein